MAAWVWWLVAAGVLAAAETASLGFVLLMLAGGALGGVAAALAGGAVPVQLAAFAAVSVVLLVLVRPVATRRLGRDTPLQLDGVTALIGRTARVTRPVDVHGGRIRLGADEWSARTQSSGESFAVGETVRILQVDGATAVVGEAFE